MITSETISFNINNTTNGEVPVSLFGNYGDPMDNANASTRYSWDITGFSVTNENLILLQYKGANQTFFQIATLPFSGTTIAEVITALNSLNLGSFFITTSGGNTYINNYNDNVAFANLQIINTGTTSLTYSWNFNGIGGQAQIDVNFIPTIVNLSPTFASGSVAVVGGDTISLSKTASSLPTNYAVYDITAGAYLVNQNVAPTVNFLFNFPIVANHSYLATITA